jgi:SAM-dependent methyltransferase
MAANPNRLIRKAAEKAARHATAATQTALSFVRRTSFSPLPQLFVYDRAAIDEMLRTLDRTPRGGHQAVLDGCLAKVPPGGYVLDVGSSKRVIHPRALSIDLQEGADIVYDMMQGLPFPSGTFDLCVCTAVLEHVPDPYFLVQEMRRVLKPGGRVHAAIPFLQPFHAAPNDYQRYTEVGIRHLFRDFNEEEVRWSSGFGETMAWLLREWRTATLDELQNQEGIVKEIFIDRWQQFHDAVQALDHNQNLHSDPRRGLYVAGGISFEGTKR